MQKVSLLICSAAKPVTEVCQAPICWSKYTTAALRIAYSIEKVESWLGKTEFFEVHKTWWKINLIWVSLGPHLLKLQVWLTHVRSRDFLFLFLTLVFSLLNTKCLIPLSCGFLLTHLFIPATCIVKKFYLILDQFNSR